MDDCEAHGLANEEQAYEAMPFSANTGPQIESDAAKIKTKAGLLWPRAVFHALFYSNIDFYPRLNATRYRFPLNIKVQLQKFLRHRRLPVRMHRLAESLETPQPNAVVIASLKSEDILRQMGKAMEDWSDPIDTGDAAFADAASTVLDQIIAAKKLNKDELEKIKVAAKIALEKRGLSTIPLDDAIDLAKASLEEVKAQTEYQDQKATRLLTVTTFLSALSGALFANFSSNYPLRMGESLSSEWRATLVGAYVTFVLFVLAAVAGALVTFHATRTRFKYSRAATTKSQEGPTRSYLFFREMIGVSPKGWAESFVVTENGKPLLRPMLKQEYLKNYVSESYLVAAKTADKLRYLVPAQSLLAWALRFLLVFVILIAVIQANVARLPPVPADVRLVWPTGSVSANVRVSPVQARDASPPHVKTGRVNQFEAQVRITGH